MPANLIEINRDILTPGLALLPDSMDSEQARVMLLAIGLQESRFTARRQHPLRPGMPHGPANGFWQFERGGGVKGVLLHKASRGHAEAICKARGLNPDARTVWEALATDDSLAVVFARLLLFTDPAPLPAVGAADTAWAYYLRNWRPGKPHKSTWRTMYMAAQAALS